MSNTIDLSPGKAGVLAESTVRYGRTASDAIQAWNSAYSINSVNKDEATVLSMVTMVASARPTAIKDAYEAAYAVNPISDKEALDLATRMVLRGYQPSNFKPTYERLYAINEVSDSMAEQMVKAAVSANASADQVADAYAWYRSQPGGDKSQATAWTVDHLKEQSGGFDQWHDQTIAELRAKVGAVS
jgi:DNA-binding ferritin-like protein